MVGMMNHPGVLLAIIFVLLFFIGFLVYVLLGQKLVKIDGEVVVSTKEDGGLLYLLELDIDPDELEHKSILTFQVRK
jgi:hypothetical protein